MYKFSQRSIDNLQSCHVELVCLFREVIQFQDCSIICGHRAEKEQTIAYDQGFSKLEFPNSRHNLKPSMAVDVVPYPIVWKDYKRFYRFAYIVKEIARRKNIPIRWGGDWDGDDDFTDQSFMDFPHFELTGVNYIIGEF